ncbi:uncharacterized protein LOC134825908 [Bolinopsis microptera]|uniref:uncharacterized protein LOC134825908 n=1 Tax=Bolinopsis microptera TaxID=2820187 RepID=UPI00307946B7
MKPRWLIKIFDRIKDVMDKNKTLDDVALIKDYWQNKISEKYLSSGDLTDDTTLPTSQEPIPQGSHVIMDSDYQSSLSDELSVKKKERARVLIQHDQWLYVRDEQGQEGFVPLNMCHKESNVSIEVTQCKAISKPSSVSSCKRDSINPALSENLAVPSTSEKSLLLDDRPKIRPTTSSLCDSGCPSDSESDCFPLTGELTDRDRLGELEKLLSQLCTEGNFYEAARSLDNFSKQLNIRKSCAKFIAESSDEVNTETGQLLVELGRVGNCALVCTDKGERGYLPTSYLLTDTKKIACFSMEKTIFQSQSMENVQHDQRFKGILGGHITTTICPSSPRQPCVSASSLYDIKRKIHRSYKIRKHDNMSQRFSKIRNFTIGTPRDNRVKLFKRNLTNCIALIVIDNYTVGSGSRQFTMIKGDTLITTDSNISSKTWIWVHTTGVVKWQGFVPRVNVKKISASSV